MTFQSNFGPRRKRVTPSLSTGERSECCAAYDAIGDFIREWLEMNPGEWIPEPWTLTTAELVVYSSVLAKIMSRRGAETLRQHWLFWLRMQDEPGRGVRWGEVLP